MYCYDNNDVLRNNIGLLQFTNEEYYYEDEPINEGILDMFRKKPTRWQRFKSFVGRNKGKLAAGALGLGAAGWTGNSLSNYGKSVKRVEDDLKQKGYKKYKGFGWSLHDIDKLEREGKNGEKFDAFELQGWNPLKSYSDEAKGKASMTLNKTDYRVNRNQ